MHVQGVTTIALFRYLHPTNKSLNHRVLYRILCTGGNDMYPLARHAVNAYNPCAPIYSGSQVCLTVVSIVGVLAAAAHGDHEI